VAGMKAVWPHDKKKGHVHHARKRKPSSRKSARQRGAAQWKGGDPQNGGSAKQLIGGKGERDFGTPHTKKKKKKKKNNKKRHTNHPKKNKTQNPQPNQKKNPSKKSKKKKKTTTKKKAICGVSLKRQSSQYPASVTIPRRGRGGAVTLGDEKGANTENSAGEGGGGALISSFGGGGGNSRVRETKKEFI